MKNNKNKYLLILLGGAVAYYIYKRKENALSKFTVELSKLRLVGTTGTTLDFTVDAIVNNPTLENVFIPKAFGSISVGSKKISNFATTIGKEVTANQKSTLPMVFSIKISDFVAAGLDILKGINKEVIMESTLTVGSVDIPVRQKFDLSFLGSPKEQTTDIPTPTVVEPLALATPNEVGVVNLNGDLDAEGGIIISVTPDQLELLRPGTLSPVTQQSSDVLEVELEGGNTIIALPKTDVKVTSIVSA